MALGRKQRPFSGKGQKREEKYQTTAFDDASTHCYRYVLSLLRRGGLGRRRRMLYRLPRQRRVKGYWNCLSFRQDDILSVTCWRRLSSRPLAFWVSLSGIGRGCWLANMVRQPKLAWRRLECLLCRGCFGSVSFPCVVLFVGSGRNASGKTTASMR